jgi:hypothetical protein
MWDDGDGATVAAFCSFGESFKRSFFFVLADYDIFVKMTAEPLVRDETVYWDIKEFYLHIDTLKLFQVNFENLFNGDKELGKLKMI